MPRSFYGQLEACKRDIECWLEENGPLADGADFLYELADNLEPQSPEELANFAIEARRKGDISGRQLVSGSVAVFVRDVGVRALWEHFYNIVRRIQDRGVCEWCAGYLPRDPWVFEAEDLDHKFLLCSEDCYDRFCDEGY